MHRFSICAALALGASLLLGQNTTAPPKPPAVKAMPTPDPVVLTIGSEKITQKQFETFVAALPENLKQQAATPQGKRELARQLGEVKALGQEARRRKLDQDPVTAMQLSLQADSMLANALYQEVLKATVLDDAALAKYYDEHKQEFETVKARHILIRYKGSPVPIKQGKQDLSEEEALAKVNSIKTRLAKGEDFAEVAKTESEDSGTAQTGGDLGTFSRGQMVAAFEQAAFSLPVNTISDPVKTQFGYHLIQVTEHANKTLADVKPQIEQRLKPEQGRAKMDELKKVSPVTLNDAYFGPAEPPAPPAPPAAEPAKK